MPVVVESTIASVRKGQEVASAAALKAELEATGQFVAAVLNNGKRLTVSRIDDMGSANQIAGTITLQ